MASPLRERLLALLARESYFERQGVTLTSGRTSNYYIDCKRTLYIPEGAYLAGELMLEFVVRAEIEQLGGMAAGALPVTDAVIAAAYRHRTNIAGFFVRKETKAHGLQQQVEGAFRKGARTAVIDDTITSGGSSLVAAEAARAAGAEIVMALALVDRGEGAANAFRRAGLEYQYLFDAEEIRAARRRA